MLTPEEQELIDRYKHPRFSGTLDNATMKAEGINASCGDEIHMEAVVSDGIIRHIRHQTRGCAICTASADLLSDHLEGKEVSRITSLTPDQALDMLPIQVSPARLKCALLALNTAKRLK